MINCWQLIDMVKVYSLFVRSLFAIRSLTYANEERLNYEQKPINI